MSQPGPQGDDRDPSPEAAPSWQVPAALDGERVDRTVALLTGCTRALAADLVAAGRIHIGRSTVRSGSRRVHQGEALRIDGGALRAAEVRPEDLADADVTVKVVHADADVIVVDKPAGLVVHPGSGHPRGTLVQGLAAVYPDLIEMAASGSADDASRPGIVHRLDRGTSGLLMVARTEVARVSLVAQLAARSVERRYRALVAGRIAADEGLIDAPLGRSSSDPTRRAVRVDGRDARTTYCVLSRYPWPAPVTLIECRLETGRTHQIRVHLAAIGHPLVGDGRYGGPPPVNTDERDRPWLHAEVLGFDHPRSAERLTFTSSIPTDLAEALAPYREAP